MASGEIAEFLGASAGFAIAALAVVVTVGVFTALARIGNGVRTSTDKK